MATAGYLSVANSHPQQTRTVIPCSTSQYSPLHPLQKTLKKTVFVTIVDIFSLLNIIITKYVLGWRTWCPTCMIHCRAWPWSPSAEGNRVENVNPGGAAFDKGSVIFIDKHGARGTGVCMQPFSGAASASIPPASHQLQLWFRQEGLERGLVVRGMVGVRER